MIIPYTLSIINNIALATQNRHYQNLDKQYHSAGSSSLNVASQEKSKHISFGEPILSSLGAIYGWTLLGLHPVEALVTFIPVLAAQRLISLALFDTKASYFEAALKFIGRKAQQLENTPNPDKNLVKELYEAAKYMTKSYKYKWATDPRSLAGQTLFVQTFDDTKLARKNLYFVHSLLKKDMGGKFPNAVKEIEQYFTTGVYSPKNLQSPKVPDFKLPLIKIPDLKLPKQKIKPIKKTDIQKMEKPSPKPIELKKDKKMIDSSPVQTSTPGGSESPKPTST